MTAPGWFPDPYGQSEQRWWDGAQWTGHVHPPLAQTSPVVDARQPESTPQADGAPQVAGAPQIVAQQQHPASLPPRGRSSARTWWIAGIASVVVLALLVTVSVIAVRGFLGLDRQVALPVDAESVPDRAYAMTEPLLDLSPSTEFTFPAHYDFEERSGGEMSFSYAWAFELFLDPGLTHRADLFVWQSDPGAQLEISPSESTWLARADDGTDYVDVMSDAADKNFSWGLEPEYYLVRHIDENGDALTEPVVTKFSSQDPGFTAPTVRADTDVELGAMTLSWAPVADATDYIVIGSHGTVTNSSEGRMYEVLATTSDTSWSSADDRYEGLDDGYGAQQNINLVSFDGQSADDLIGQGTQPEDDEWRYETSGYRFGVIATNGTDYSRISTADTASVVEALPYETATYAMGDSSAVFSRQGLDELPVSFAFTALDGRTRSTQAVIPEGGIEVSGRNAIITIHGVGTQLTYGVTWYGVDEGFDAEAWRGDYNARAAAAVATTGGSVVISKSLDEVKIDSTPLVDAAVVDYPVYGSDDYVRFLAGHMIAGSSLIDITQYADAPGAQSVYDALEEARSQNPYVVDVSGYGETSSGESTIVRLEYDLDAAERTRIQQSIAGSVDQILAGVVTEGMSDRDKAAALNDWIAANAQYDYDALAASDAGDASAYGYAWRADGIFQNGAAVCGGYAIAYSALMNAAGVETVYVTGDVLNGGRHAWNKVRIDGSWYAVDPTWNDSPAPNRYLLISDAQFTDSATRSEDLYWIRDDLIGAFATP